MKTKNDAFGHRKTMGVCVICGQAFLRDDPKQRTCSPECQEKKNRGLDSGGKPVRKGMSLE